MRLEGVATPDGGPSLFVQGRDVSLGNLSVDGDYVMIKANRLAFGGTVASSDPDALVQLAPLDGGTSMTLTQSGATTATGAYTNAGHLSFCPSGTLALGTTAHSGNVVIAADGSLIDIGDSNLFVLTTGSATGLDSVRSTGI